MIDVKNVSLRYIAGDFKDIGLKEYLIRKTKGESTTNEFWALKDISFHVNKGEMLGIIGSNGSGKSTILKVLAGIIPPTNGRIKTNGSVAALLELGTGFDGDLTVKENIFLRGALLGYTKDYMLEEYDSIIDFSELKEFETLPYKKLSSGMKSKLAFSIASRVNPDILILDEVLSVGDIAFKRKSESRMNELMGGGTTTILVSHSINQIRCMCTKVVWLEQGDLRGIGDSKIMCNEYEKYMKRKNKK